MFDVLYQLALSLDKRGFILLFPGEYGGYLGLSWMLFASRYQI